MREERQVAFVGSGTMAEAMIRGLIARAGMAPERIAASGPRAERARELAGRYGIRCCTDNAEAAEGADLVVLTVKPQVLPAVLSELAGRLRPEALLVSIVTGARLADLQEGFGHKPVVRAMPNTPAQIGRGMTVWMAAPDVTAGQRRTARSLFRTFGEEEEVAEEGDLDRATALSGTGPAYVFLFLEALVEAGVHLGFSRRLSEKLVLQTVRGSAAYGQEAGAHLAALRNQVTSPGGTSAEALYHLEKGGLRTVLADAVWAAYRRAVALGEAGAAAGRTAGEAAPPLSEAPSRP